MAINLVAHNCKIYCICGWKTGLELVVTSLDQDWKRPQSWSFPVLVWSFEVLENVWTGLGLGLFILSQKTRLDWTFKHYPRLSLRLKLCSSHTHSHLVLFLPCPQNHVRKCLCSLRTLKPCHINIPESFDMFVVPELLLALQIQPISHLDVAFHW